MTETDWKNLKVLLLRVNCTGAEAITVASLMMKIDEQLAGISPPQKLVTEQKAETGIA